MEEKTLEELYQISYLSENGMVTPIMLDYYRMNSKGKKDEETLVELRKKYIPETKQS